MDITLHITVQQPPAGFYYGLQKGSGSQFENEQVRLSAGVDLDFSLTVGVKTDAQTGLPRFGGPFVQGPAGGKFIYIGIGAYAGHESAWSGRLKIPLSGITAEMVAAADNGLQTYVAGTGKNGMPACATVKPFSGWKIRDQA
ncbi:MAG TPA: DUF5990 family protein [Mucilaginibacter sp.]|nr:DUF5990 family protein [Mucilaginibacter sp.]